MMNSEQGLPDGWTWKDLEEICVPPQYGWTTKGLADGKLHLLRTTDITSGSINWDTVPFCAEEPSDQEKYLLHDGDIVISRAGSVGYSHLIKNPKPAVFASYLIRFRPLINEKYVAFFLQSPAYWQAISEQSLGIAIPNVNASKLKKIRVPIAPENEQERIVAKIEELFTQLEAGTSALERVQAGLRRYKASVLKAAVEGRLLGDDKVAYIRQHGDLPKGWRWATIGELSLKSQYGTSEKADLEPSGIPVLRMGNIQEGELDFENLKYLPKDTKGIKDLILDDGDLLFNRTNSAELVGKTAVYKKHHPKATFASYLIRVKFNEAVVPDFVSYYINSAYGRRYIKSVVSQQVGQANVNGTKLANMPIILPPLEEQRRIVAEVERRLSVAREVESVVEKALVRSARLRQSVLKHAFEGKLT